MLSKTVWKMAQLSRLIWVRVVLISLLAILAALASALFQRFIPDALEDQVSVEAVTRILNILASSMLAVVTFSLSIMVTAYRGAASEMTPRVHRLLLADTTTQTVLATFLGAFLFALVSIILLSTRVYAGKSIIVILGFTLIVVGFVVIAILRWIDHLSDLGSMDETVRKVTAAATRAMEMRFALPCLGGRPLIGALPPGLVPLSGMAEGFVRHIDLSALSDCAEEAEVEVYLEAQPGRYLFEGAALAHLSGAVPDRVAERMRGAFDLGALRSFDQDPRFGLIVLSEIGSRALSPGINDPGTAIDIIARLHRVLRGVTDEAGEAEDRRHPRLHVRALSIDDLMMDAYAAIARDGAGMIEVQIRLMKALADLATRPLPAMAQAARVQAARALAHAEAALVLEADRQVLRELAPG